MGGYWKNATGSIPKIYHNVGNCQFTGGINYQLSISRKICAPSPAVHSFKALVSPHVLYVSVQLHPGGGILETLRLLVDSIKNAPSAAVFCIPSCLCNHFFDIFSAHFVKTLALGHLRSSH